MNKRKKKKNARIENNWYKEKSIEDYNCPCCSWCALNDDEFKYHKTLDNYSDYFGVIHFKFEVKCPHCGTKFEYYDSNM